MKSNNFNESIKGFFWGIGFVIAILGGISAFALTIAADVDSEFKTMVSNKALETSDEINNDYKLTLSEIYKENGQVRIAAELKNITNESIYTGTVIASTFDESGKFIGNCVGKSTESFLEPSEVSYVDIKCNLFRSQASKVHSTKLKIKWF